MSTGAALRLRLELARLAQRHRVSPALVYDLPLAPPAFGDIIVTGYASTPDVDQTRMKLRPFALNWLPWKLPKLLYRHRADAVAGTIETLAYDDERRLCIRARVTHPEAKQCGGFSVGCTIRSYEIRSADTADFHAVILSADLDEVSLTPEPCNAAALVTSRYKPSPVAENYAAIAARVAQLQCHLKSLQQEMRL